jgi:glycosyltransferase involved in cell wall biosynthesis
MRFLVASDYVHDPDSGAAGTIHASNAALRELGHDVEEIWRDDLPHRIRHGNLHYLLELPHALKREIRRRCDAKTYDVILASQPHAWMAARDHQRLRRPGVFLNRSHGWEGQTEQAMRTYARDAAPPVSPVRRLARRAMQALLTQHQPRIVRHADGIVAGCTSVARHLEANYSISPDRIAVIPYGIPDAFLETPLSERLDRWRRILHVAQFAPVKAPSLVAAAMGEILRRHPQISAGWVCDSSHHAEVRRLLGPDVRDRVALHPWVGRDALIDLYDRYGLFLFASYCEGYGKTPFEAMARGLAVVSTAVGGMADWIRSGENGCLCEPGDWTAMVRSLDELLADPAKAQAMGRAAAETARGLTWREHAQQLAAFAERLLADKAVRGVRPDLSSKESTHAG